MLDPGRHPRMPSGGQLRPAEAWSLLLPRTLPLRMPRTLRERTGTGPHHWRKRFRVWMPRRQPQGTSAWTSLRLTQWSCSHWFQKLPAPLQGPRLDVLGEVPCPWTGQRSLLQARGAPRLAGRQLRAPAGPPRPTPRWTLLTRTWRWGHPREAAASPPAGGPAPLTLGLPTQQTGRAGDWPCYPLASPRRLAGRMPGAWAALRRGCPPPPSLTGSRSSQTAAPGWRTPSGTPGGKDRTGCSWRRGRGTPLRMLSRSRERTRIGSPGPRGPRAGAGGCPAAGWGARPPQLLQELQRGEGGGDVSLTPAVPAGSLS